MVIELIQEPDGLKKKLASSSSLFFNSLHTIFWHTQEIIRHAPSSSVASCTAVWRLSSELDFFKPSVGPTSAELLLSENQQRIGIRNTQTFQLGLRKIESKPSQHKKKTCLICNYI